MKNMQNNLYFQRLDTKEIGMFKPVDLDCMTCAIITLFAFMEVPFKFLSESKYQRLADKRIMTGYMHCSDPESGTYVGELIEEYRAISPKEAAKTTRRHYIKIRP